MHPFDVMVLLARLCGFAPYSYCSSSSSSSSSIHVTKSNTRKLNFPRERQKFRFRPSPAWRVYSTALLPVTAVLAALKIWSGSYDERTSVRGIAFTIAFVSRVIGSMARFLGPVCSQHPLLYRVLNTDLRVRQSCVVCLLCIVPVVGQVVKEFVVWNYAWLPPEDPVDLTSLAILPYAFISAMDTMFFTYLLMCTVQRYRNINEDLKALKGLKRKTLALKGAHRKPELEPDVHSVQMDVSPLGTPYFVQSVPKVDVARLIVATRRQYSNTTDTLMQLNACFAAQILAGFNEGIWVAVVTVFWFITYSDDLDAPLVTSLVTTILNEALLKGALILAGEKIRHQLRLFAMQLSQRPLRVSFYEITLDMTLIFTGCTAVASPLVILLQFYFSS